MLLKRLNFLEDIFVLSSKISTLVGLLQWSKVNLTHPSFTWKVKRCVKIFIKTRLLSWFVTSNVIHNKGKF